MTETFERRVFWDRSDIPEGTKALVIQVKDPILTLVATEDLDAEHKIFEHKTAFVEITLEEWTEVKNDQAKADALAKQFGGLVQAAMGASWHRWHDAES